MKTALNINRHELAIQRAADAVYNYALREYIADANRNAVLDRLYYFYNDTDVHIISKTEYKELLAIKETVLQIDLNKVNTK